MLASSADQINSDTIKMVFGASLHAALRTKSKDWFPLNQDNVDWFSLNQDNVDWFPLNQDNVDWFPLNHDNVTKCYDMSICELLFL